jgi:Pyruvate/2-oxoacid:ferredoxin oxidoreductase delta subunit
MLVPQVSSVTSTFKSSCFVSKGFKLGFIGYTCAKRGLAMSFNKVIFNESVARSVVAAEKHASCGTCTTVCPFNCLKEKSDFMKETKLAVLKHEPVLLCINRAKARGTT